jgi:hypothetical protein
VARGHPRPGAQLILEKCQLSSALEVGKRLAENGQDSLRSDFGFFFPSLRSESCPCAARFYPAKMNTFHLHKRDVFLRVPFNAAQLAK